MILISIIIPVYNRPEELKELLDSLTIQHFKENTEIIVVEDGSSLTSEEAISQFQGQLAIRYVRQDNAGPAKARNTGASLAQGKILMFFDSDCTLPSDFFDKVYQSEVSENFDCFGTRDAAHTFFSPIQKAISYSMTSIFTTGGIRGANKKKMDKFYPRSYSMGIRRNVFEAVDGFAAMRYGEDIDLSIRIEEAGYKLGLIPDTFVYHKRRSTFRSFFKQTFCSGTARIDLAMRHKGALKLVHLLPSIAVVMLCILLVLSVAVSWLFLLPIVAYGLLIFFHSYSEFKSIKVSLLSIVASAMQICGYGLGFIYNVWQRLICHRMNKVPFRKSLYK